MHVNYFKKVMKKLPLHKTRIGAAVEKINKSNKFALI